MNKSQCVVRKLCSLSQIQTTKCLYTMITRLRKYMSQKHVKYSLKYPKYSLKYSLKTPNIPEYSLKTPKYSLKYSIKIANIPKYAGKWQNVQIIPPKNPKYAHIIPKS